MRKSEMSRDQLREREQVASKLQAAGWKPGDWHRLFDKGELALWEAELTYDSRAMALWIIYNAPKRRLFLKIETRSGKQVELAIHFGAKLDAVLDAIVAFQDKINARNFRTHLAGLLRVCPEIDVVRGTQFVRLLADRADEMLGKKGK